MEDTTANKMQKAIRSLSSIDPSRLTIWLIALFLSIIIFQNQGWQKEKVLRSDALAYYTYLPAIFIYNDLKLEFFTQPGDHHEAVKGKAWITFGPNGERIIQVSYGISLLYLPFFLLAHAYASIMDISPYGFSWPYQFAVQIAALFYLTIGLFFLRKVLRRYFNGMSTALALLAIVLGTNLIYYATIEPGMSHLFSFFLISVFIYFLTSWLTAPTWKVSIWLGIITGFVVLVRPSNLLMITLFLFWEVASWDDIKERVRFLLRNLHKVLIMVIFSLIVWIPQFLYWDYIVGHYVYFSYGENAHFFWGEPQIINILFSYRKGWLLYTPMMVLAIIGIFAMKKSFKGGIIASVIVLLSYIYVLSCWCFWWFGGGYGSRGFIDIYPVMALPLAAIIQWGTTTKNKLYSIVFGILFLILIIHSFFQFSQYRHGAIHYANMTKEAYWDSFGRQYPSKQFYNLLDPPPYDEVKARIRKAKGLDQE